MISKHLRAPPFTHIGTFVEYQLYTLGFLALLVLGLLIYRNWKAVRVQNLKGIYADALIAEMLAYLEFGSASAMIPVPRFYEFEKREVLKTVFLEHFNSVNGPEKVFLAGRYADLLFTLDDYNTSTSLIWWNRLQAVSNLSLIGLDEFGPLLNRMTKDRNGLVAATASLALSGLRSEYNKPKLITELPRAILERKNLLFEILKNWSLVHGPGAILAQIQSVRDPHLLGVLVFAAASLQSPEVAEAYANLLRDRSDLPPEAIQEMLALLRRVGDPTWVEIVRTYLSHPQEIIRLRALEYLYNMGEVEILDEPLVRRDPSVVIQRWLKANSTEVAA